jgi:hypothetical protein
LRITIAALLLTSAAFVSLPYIPPRLRLVAITRHKYACGA